MWGTGRARVSIPSFVDDDLNSPKNKEKKWTKLLKDITAIIEFYIFVYEIKTKLVIISHSDTTVFRFTNLESRQFLYTLKKELERIFNTDFITGGFMDGDLFIRVYLDSEEVDFVK